MRMTEEIVKNLEASRLVHLLHLRARKNTCFSSAPFLEPPVFLCLDCLRKVTLTLETNHYF